MAVIVVTLPTLQVCIIEHIRVGDPLAPFHVRLAGVDDRLLLASSLNLDIALIRYWWCGGFAEL